MGPGFPWGPSGAVLAGRMVGQGAGAGPKAGLGSCGGDSVGWSWG